MNVLEKILEEIENRVNFKTSLVRYEKKKGTITDVARNQGALEELIIVEKIIRSHMDHSGDDTEMGGWIPVSEGVPEDGTYLCTLDGELCGTDEPFTGMCGIEKGKWDEEGCVIAWKPLPEPYKGGE